MDLWVKGHAYFKAFDLYKLQETICFGNQISTNTISSFAKHNKPFSEAREGSPPTSSWPASSFPSVFSLNVTLSEMSCCLSHTELHLSFSFYIPFADVFSSVVLSTSDSSYVCSCLYFPRSMKVGTLSILFVLCPLCLHYAQHRVSAQ